MPLTKSFQETIKDCLQDPHYRKALLEEAITCFFNGEFSDAKALLRDFINGTCGFKKLSQDVGLGEKTLMRMLSKDGNPTTRNLLALFGYLQKQEKQKVEIHLVSTLQTA